MGFLFDPNEGWQLSRKPLAQLYKCGQPGNLPGPGPGEAHPSPGADFSELLLKYVCVLRSRIPKFLKMDVIFLSKRLPSSARIARCPGGGVPHEIGYRIIR